MKNLKALLAVPAAFGAVLAVSGNAVAAESLVESAAVESFDVEATDTEVVVAEPIQLAQVTSVSELSDVRAGDWAFTALQRLVEEYGCLEGYPDRTFRGNRAMTRYEFAAGLNACLDVVIQLIGGGDIDGVQRLQEEFAAELATLRGRTDLLEADVAELEANQFSTTTKLRGQLDANLVVPFGDTTEIADGTALDGGPSEALEAGDGNVGGEEADATFDYRARLNFDTSFTGEDRLRIRLQASDDAGALANTEGGLASQSGPIAGVDDNLGLDDVFYSFPIGNRFSGIVAANSIVTDDFVTSTIVPFDGPAVADASGPEFYDLYQGGDAFGAGVNIAFTDNLVLDLGYSTDTGNVNRGFDEAGDLIDPDDTGLFNNYSYIAQLNFLTDGFIDAAVAYIDGDQDGEGSPEYTVAGLVNLDFGRVQVAGHYAYTPAEGDGDLDSYGGGINFPELFGGNLGAYAAISPNVDRDPLLVEAYYELALNEYFTLTPAVIYADNDSDIGDDDNFYGALRATFRF
ncbi:carbohydrate-selective porin, OprB family [Synechococcus sp. PCC 7335]|uniref:iron uptake porin n=1 Tax=Synechococcus sp. (strain ATCC 29403 / PCC 7335) TaxID=91464 RepID=UPI00017ED585|nr:iron uptake porin [Synechococcus sp. PCC 7335]EDX86780.1 carbohydrate-selective porin, OprB family [Synechococcus sp. PCC 7335]